MFTNSVESLSTNEKCNFVNDHASYEPTKRRGAGTLQRPFHGTAFSRETHSHSLIILDSLSMRIFFLSLDFTGILKWLQIVFNKATLNSWNVLLITLTGVIIIIADRMRDVYFPVSRFCQFLPIRYLLQALDIFLLFHRQPTTPLSAFRRVAASLEK